MVTFPMTLTEPQPGFQGHGIFEVEYLKYRAFNGQSFYRTLKIPALYRALPTVSAIARTLEPSTGNVPLRRCR